LRGPQRYSNNTKMVCHSAVGLQSKC